MTCKPTPEAVRKLHRAGVVVWLLLIPVTFLTPMRDSLGWTNFMSIYAIVVAHSGAMAGTEATIAAGGG